MPRVLTNRGQQLLDEFRRRVDEADRIDIVTAWATDCEALEALAEANCDVRAVVGLSDRITVPNALETLRDRGNVKVVDPPSGIFHPKVYIFRSGRKTLGWTGSANFSKGGFSSNYELVLETTSLSASSTLTKWFDGLWDQPCCKVLTDELLKDYRSRFNEKPGQEPGVPPDASRRPATGKQAVAKGKDSKRIVIVQHGVRPRPHVPGNYGRKKAEGQVTVAGKSYAYDSATTCMKLVLEKLQERDPSFLGQCWRDPRFKKKRGESRYVARTEAELGSKGFRKYAIPMDNDWWLPTQTQTQEKWKVVEAAADVAGIEIVCRAKGQHGREVEGKLWQAERRAKIKVGF